MDLDFTKRVKSIDRYRGLMNILMVFFAIAAQFPCFGFISRFSAHADDPIYIFHPDFVFSDLIVPVFIFIIAISFSISFKKRYERDGKKAYYHFAYRYFVLIGFGKIIATVEDYLDKDPTKYEPVYAIISIIAVVGLIIRFIIIPFKKKLSKKAIIGLNLVFDLPIIALALCAIVSGISDVIICSINLFTNKGLEVYKHWSVLHTIGITSALMLPFARMKPNKKIYWFLGIAALYGIITNLPGVLEGINNITVIGGLPACFGLLLVALSAMIMCDCLFEHKYKKFIVLLGVTLLITAILIAIPLISKSSSILLLNSRGASINYIFFAIALNGALFLLISLFENKEFKHFRILQWWGKNSIFLYILCLSLKAIFLVLPFDTNNIYIGIGILLFAFVVVTTVTCILDKKNIYIKI